MGKYKFRFSDMMPNAWFYKLKDMEKHKNQSNEKSTINSSVVSSSLVSSASSSSSTIWSSSASVAAPNHTQYEQRKSYYFTRELTSQTSNSPRHSDKQFRVETPRKSPRRRRSTRRSRATRREKQRPPVTSSVAGGCSCGETMESVWTDPAPEFASGQNPKYPLPDPTSSYENDTVLTEFGYGTPDGVLSWPTSCERQTQNDSGYEGKKFGMSLHPIITKKNKHPPKIQTKAHGSLSVKIAKTESANRDVQRTTTPGPVRRFPANPSSSGVKLRSNSPRIGTRLIEPRKNVGSNSVLESLAVVKSSKNPRRDFTSSMVEMIVENNLRDSNELEDLLACYLSLNVDEYHDLIISVFKEIWFDFIHAPAPMGK